MRHNWLLTFVISFFALSPLYAQQKGYESERVARSFINRFPDPDAIRWGSQKMIL